MPIFLLFLILKLLATLHRLSSNTLHSSPSWPWSCKPHPSSSRVAGITTKPGSLHNLDGGGKSMSTLQQMVLRLCALDLTWRRKQPWLTILILISLFSFSLLFQLSLAPMWKPSILSLWASIPLWLAFINLKFEYKFNSKFCITIVFSRPWENKGLRWPHHLLEGQHWINTHTQDGTV